MMLWKSSYSSSKRMVRRRRLKRLKMGRRCRPARSILRAWLCLNSWLLFPPPQPVIPNAEEKGELRVRTARCALQRRTERRTIHADVPVPYSFKPSLSDMLE